MSDQALERLLDGVWDRRRAELLQRVEQMWQDLQQARRGDLAAWVSLGQRAHRFTGAVGTLGFAEAAAASGRVEDAVSRHPDPTQELLDAVEADLRALAAEMRVARARPRA